MLSNEIANKGQRASGITSPSGLTCVSDMFSWAHDPWRRSPYRLAFALSRAVKIVRGLRQGLTEAERYAVADHVVGQLKERGDPWRLSEEAPISRPPTT